MAFREIGTIDEEEFGHWAGVASDNGITVATLVLAGLILFTFTLYRYLRSFIYPCLTPFELDQALKDLDAVYPTSKNGVADAAAQEWNAIANDCLKQVFFLYLMAKLTKFSLFQSRNRSIADPREEFPGFTMEDISR
ncbi:hypothetical protein L218DRAFT_1080436, partial [Marasmius fiardii PR-910]